MGTVTVVLAIIGAAVSLAGTLTGLGLWLGRKLERIEGNFTGLRREIKGVHQRSDRHSSAIKLLQNNTITHSLEIDRLKRPGSEGSMATNGGR